jgi:hypothetical protein
MKQERTRLSLRPLSFDEAVTDILKIKPEPKPPKKKRAAKMRRRAPYSIPPRSVK